MEFIEIMVIILAVAIVVGVIGNYIYKKITHQVTGECRSCQNRMKKNFEKISKEIRCECEKNKQ